jgi:phosphoglucosamine mutase
MTPGFALQLGWAAGRVLGRGDSRPVLIGKDTRRSGYLFESALEAGFAAAGMDVAMLGPIPTPGVAYLTRALGASAGVVISASHNPHEDNGVKLFSAEGGKLSDALEAEIEAAIDTDIQCAAPDKVGRAHRVTEAQARYAAFCVSTYRGPSLAGLRVVLDCANGAAYKVAPDVLTQLGARLTSIGVAPDGFNINRGCGSTHTELLRERVRAEGADVGIALDGDADRCLLVTADGEVVDGDQMLYVIAHSRQAKGQLRGPVVGTLMSNLALENALARLAIPFERTDVGDRYVLERLQASGGIIGGENSGHVICLDQTTTGDGLVSALQVLEIMMTSGCTLAELVADVALYPQVLINVRVNGVAREILAAPPIAAAQQAAELALGDNGRVLLRPSGTEPLIRVMVEAREHAAALAAAESIANEVRRAAGVLVAS